MALFAIQLVRVVLASVPDATTSNSVPIGFDIASNFTIGAQEMFNVIIRSIHFFLCFTDKIYLDRASHQQ